jgi:hypothetical protein
MNRNLLLLITLWSLAFSGSGQPPPQPLVHIWYGPEQHFGQLGQAQRWVNVLGQVENSDQVQALTYALNGGIPDTLAMGSDRHRLARPGDFNTELSWEELDEGSNELLITAQPKRGKAITKTVTLHIEKGKTWPLPYWLDFSAVEQLQKVVQVVDGHWELVDDGVRTLQPYYDRVLSLGDTSWSDYETTVKLTVHGFTPSQAGPPTYNVTHFGLAMRWRGHHTDGRQPNRKWFPLGAQGEFLLKEAPDSCQWRILFDGIPDKPATYATARNRLVLGEPMYAKSQVVSLADGRSRYRYKQWLASEPEPLGWDVAGFETNDYPSGALCLVPHNSDVTLHEVRVEPVQETPAWMSARPGPGAIHFSAPVGNLFGASGASFQADFLPPGQQIQSLQVNLGPNGLIRGFRFQIHGALKPSLIGHAEGNWQETFVIPPGHELVGISGASGWYFDALQFHFSQGLSSPIYGSEGGDTAFDLRIKAGAAGNAGRIRGFYGRYDETGLESLGLIFDPAD